MRKLPLLIVALIVATGAFWATTLVNPPKTLAAVPSSAGLNISSLAVPANLPLAGSWDAH